MAIIAMAIGSAATARASLSDALVVPAPQLGAGTTTPSLLAQSPQDTDLLSGLESVQSTAHSSIVSPESDTYLLSAASGDDFYRYYVNHGNSGLVLPAPKRDLLTRSVDAVCRPTEFHLGCTFTVNCSALSAIQHKDPVRLLDPLSINISW